MRKIHDGPVLRERRAKAKARAEIYAFQYLSGKTLQEIGTANGVTREYIRQQITRHYGSLSKLGGKSVIARKNEISRQTALDNYSMKKWGCPHAEYLQLRSLKSPTRAYCQQRKNAAFRGIEWKFTLSNWWSLWQDSGKWQQRGRGSGYGVCRFGDAGPYSPDNCYIATGRENGQHYQERRHGNLSEFSTARDAA